MELLKTKSSYFISLKTSTWYKDSHALYDYESTKIKTAHFQFPLQTKVLTLFRKIKGHQVLAVSEQEESKISLEDYEILTKLAVEQSNAFKVRVKILEDVIKQKKLNSERLNTNESVDSVDKKIQKPFLIVRKINDVHNQPKGYKLQPGITLKLGRVQFYVSQMCINGVVKTALCKEKSKGFAARSVMKFNPNIQRDQKKERNPCKICFQDVDLEDDNYLLNPCKCSGSCGTVHIGCLTQWINVKVKKEIIGGTLHFNFEKFECQVCKGELPTVIQIQGKSKKELLPLERPNSNYLILEGACQKEKSVIMVQNLPIQGIKMGRGHECEIKIADISVSRNHALIKNVNNGFYIFDNKSKFGTLVRNQETYLDLSRISQGLQIGRTMLSMDLRKNKEFQKQK